MLERLTGSHPGFAAGHRELALALADLEQWDGAIRSLRRALDLDPAGQEPWRELGDLLTLTGDADGASEAYGHHFRRALDDGSLSDALHAAQDGRHADAEATLRAILD